VTCEILRELRVRREACGPVRASAVARPTTGKSLSIREFIQQLDLKKHTDISLAFGFYLENPPPQPAPRGREWPHRGKAAASKP
jgi:hypothetical protein